MAEIESMTASYTLTKSNSMSMTSTSRFNTKRSSSSCLCSIPLVDINWDAIELLELRDPLDDLEVWGRGNCGEVLHQRAADAISNLS